MQSLNILHVFRAPVGGLFRHVLDLSRGQIAQGHRVGLIVDSLTGGARAEAILGELAGQLALGLTRVPMGRHAHPRDLSALLHVTKQAIQTEADILHGHGAKGGTYARLALTRKRTVRAYTPHGGSLLLNDASLAGKFYLATERLLMPFGNLFLFESAYSADVFRSKIGTPRGTVRVVHNGVGKADFEPVSVSKNASDLVFLGELRPVKGVDILLDSLVQLHQAGQRLTLTIVGDGPDAPALRAKVAQSALQASVRFEPAMPARTALSLGQVMVIPSRAESLPYVVLEALAASKPLVTTRVGGIPEIYGSMSDGLVPANDPRALAAAITRIVDNRQTADQIAARLRNRVATAFSVETMVDGVLTSYRAAADAMRSPGKTALSTS